MHPCGEAEGTQDTRRWALIARLLRHYIARRTIGSSIRHGRQEKKEKKKIGHLNEKVIEQECVRL